jgi:hypothetical protein
MFETHKSATSLAMISFFGIFFDLLSTSVIYGEAASVVARPCVGDSEKPRNDQK